MDVDQIKKDMTTTPWTAVNCDVHFLLFSGDFIDQMIDLLMENNWHDFLKDVFTDAN